MAFWQQYGYAWVVLPFLIFCARIIDVSVATLRLTFLARGARIPTAVAGFFEALIWIIIIGQVIQNLGNAMSYLAYAGGFATGSFIGMRIEERLALGKVVLRVILPKPTEALVSALRADRHGVTCVDADGAKGPVHILFMVVKRSQVAAVVERIQHFNPKAFYTVEDIRYVNEGVFPLPPESAPLGWRSLGRWRMRFR